MPAKKTPKPATMGTPTTGKKTTTSKRSTSKKTAKKTATPKPRNTTGATNKVSKTSTVSKHNPSGHTTSHFPARIRTDVVEWVDERAAEVGLSRNAWINYALLGAMTQYKAHEQSGFLEQVVDATEQAFDHSIANLNKEQLLEYLRQIHKKARNQ